MNRTLKKNETKNDQKDNSYNQNLYFNSNTDKNKRFNNIYEKGKEAFDKFSNSREYDNSYHNSNYQGYYLQTQKGHNYAYENSSYKNETTRNYENNFCQINNQSQLYNENDGNNNTNPCNNHLKNHCKNQLTPSSKIRDMNVKNVKPFFPKRNKNTNVDSIY